MPVPPHGMHASKHKPACMHEVHFAHKCRYTEQMGSCTLPMELLMDDCHDNDTRSAHCVSPHPVLPPYSTTTDRCPTPLQRELYYVHCTT